MATVTENIEISPSGQKLIVTDQDPLAVVSEVFTTTESRSAFVRALLVLGNKVALTGNRLREQLGITSYNFAAVVAENADIVDHFGNQDEWLCSPFTDILKRYQGECFIKKDVDFVLTSGEISEVAPVFATAGFSPVDRQVASGVRVVDIPGESGQATFVALKDSWYHRPPWPKIGQLYAPLNTDEPNHEYFRLSVPWSTVHLEPLVCDDLYPVSESFPLHHLNMGAVGIGLLWSFTLSGPDGDLLLPGPENRSDYYWQAAFFPYLMSLYNRGRLPQKHLWERPIRDMSLSMFEILDKGYGWDWARSQKNLSRPPEDFYKNVIRSYQIGFKDVYGWPQF